MPKSLVLGNGNTLIGLDKFAQVKDFYYPFVGLENQTGGKYVHKIGVWVENKFSWIDDGNWEISINYKHETLASDIKATNHVLQIRLEFTDIVYNESNIFLREVTVQNLGDHKRDIRVFFHQAFEIYESFRGDTAYYDPSKKIIIHYKGRRAFLINAKVGARSFDDYGIGLFNIEGKEGTFRDAEDGSLSKNAVEHGLVDSVIGLRFDLDPHESWVLHYWVTVAKSIQEAEELNEYVLKRSPEHLLKTTQDFWTAWVNKEGFHFEGLSQEVVDLFKKSLLIIRTQIDNQGAVIASADSDMLEHGRDTYAYMWPRDGALVTSALDKAGDDNVARRFFEFCNQVISEGGYFMHKYRADQSLGSSWHPWARDGVFELPIQEDETALVIIALWEHYELSKDLEFIEQVYNSMIKKAGEFMVNYRDHKTGLPKPSYDLWEEKFGISTFTASAVYGALVAASKFAGLLGKVDSQHVFLTNANETKEAILNYLYDKEAGMFYKMVNLDGDKVVIDHTVDISSLYGILNFGVLEVGDERITRAMKITEDRIGLKTEIGGVARYEGDMYYRSNGMETPGNPWFITTLWLAQCHIAGAKGESDLAAARNWLSWVVKYAKSSGILSEQLNPYTGEQISAAPLTWSHSEFVLTIIKYLNKLEELGLCEECNPVK